MGQHQDDKKLHPVAYASRALNVAEKHYGITELETLAVVWAVSQFHHYVYGNTVTVYTDHMAVKAVLETPNPTGKHARWWSRVYGRGIKQIRIVYRAGKENKNVDALSQSSVSPAPQVGIAKDEVQISSVGAAIPFDSMDYLSVHTQEPTSSYCFIREDIDEQSIPLSPSSTHDPVVDIRTLFHMPHTDADTTEDVGTEQDTVNGVRVLLRVSTTGKDLEQDPFAWEQRQDPAVKEIIDFLESGTLPEDATRARKLALQESLFTLVSGILYFIDPNTRIRRGQLFQDICESKFCERPIQVRTVAISPDSDSTIH